MSGKKSGEILTKKILFLIFDTGRHCLEDLFLNEEKRRLKKGIYYLRKKEYISVKEIDGKTELQLRKKGRDLVLKYSLQDIKISKDKKWDGIWRMVCFDIPENKKSARNYFKSVLDRLGFALLQKSIYVLPYECRNEIDFIIGTLGIGPYVTYIEAKEIGASERLVKRFNLK